MKKTLWFAALALSLSNLHAEPTTDLSKKARTLRMYASRNEVIKLLGNPSAAILPADFKANQLDETPDLAYVLSWDNKPCSRVEVFFNSRNAATGVGWWRTLPARF